MNRWTIFGGALVILAAGLFVLYLLDESEQYELSIAAGEAGSRSYELAEAIGTVVERYHPEIRVISYATRGPLQNARLLEQGAVDLAIAELDLISGVRAQLVADLYPSSFHLVARNDSNIKEFSDLAGKTVALPPVGTSQYNAFWFLARNYGLGPRQITTIPGTELDNEWLYQDGTADAVFRIRAAGDDSIRRIMEYAPSVIIPIRRAGALRLESPALSESVLPLGSYSGQPPVPDDDVRTVAIREMLLAHVDTPAEPVSVITSVLFERRRDLIGILPLSGYISAPNSQAGLYLPLHEGAARYFARNEPNFLQENAEPIAVLLSVIVVLASIYLHILAKQKRRLLETFNQELVGLARRARAATSFGELDSCDAELSSYVDKILDASAAGQISSGDFNLFEFTFQATEDAIRDRENQLRRLGTASPEPAGGGVIA